MPRFQNSSADSLDRARGPATMYPPRNRPIRSEEIAKGKGGQVADELPLRPRCPALDMAGRTREPFAMSATLSISSASSTVVAGPRSTIRFFPRYGKPFPVLTAPFVGSSLQQAESTYALDRAVSGRSTKLLPAFFRKTRQRPISTLHVC